MSAATRWCRSQTEPLNVVTLLCDNGAKYLSKMFNDFWMIDNGFIEREHRNDLRDLIARRHESGEDYTIGMDEPIRQAIKRLEMYGISQMVVMEKGRIVGLIDESDILLAVTKDPSNFDTPVSEFMTRRLETVSPTGKVEDLMPIFRADRVAIVVDEDGDYEGLITKIDMIEYLKRQLV